MIIKSDQVTHRPARGAWVSGKPVSLTRAESDQAEESDRHDNRN